VLALTGDADATKAIPGTIRGDFDINVAGSLIDVATSAADAERLQALWFAPQELGPAPPSAPPAAPPAAAPGPAAATKTSVSMPATADRFYLTTAINYANGAPHMGHAYEAIIGDVICRYHRAYGREVFFLTGSDEHGQKIADTAKEAGMEPIELCNKCVAGFKALNAKLRISNDDYVRTTSEMHKAGARQLWRKSLETGDVYLGVYSGWYNIREETFVTESEAALTDYKDPVSGKPYKKMEEKSYFFKLSKYQQAILDHYAAHPEAIQPEARRNEMLERLRVPLVDLSISRTTFTWGVPVPDDPDHVMYVWFDALSNYVTAMGYPDGENMSFWPAMHLVGKDITWFHCVIWPAMLLSVGLALPKTVLAHGFVHGSDGRKMSKSLGNVVDAHDVLSRFSVDSFRFFLVRDSPLGSDLTFSEDALALRHNAELADNFGNLVHRALTLCVKMTGGTVPTAAAEVFMDLGALRAETENAYAQFHLNTAMELVLKALADTNKFVTDLEPWKMSTDDPRRAMVVRTLLEAVYALTHFLQPALVETSPLVFEKLNTPAIAIRDLSPKLDNLRPGTPVSPGEVLYEKLQTADALARIEEESARKKKAVEEAAKKKAAKEALAAGGEPASELSKIDVRVGRVLTVDKHPEADGLYVETIDLGEEKPRQVVSGLVKYMSADQLKGKLVVCLANIKTSKMRGVESQAMLLCGFAADGASVELVQPPDGCAIGQRVSFEGHDGEPERQLNPKKKVWENSIQPHLNTSADCIARFKEVAFSTPQGPCRVASIANGTIK